MVPVAVVPLHVARTVALMLLGIVTVDAVKFALVAPAGTVTESGTVTFGLDETNVTMAPSGPAGPLRVTLPVDAFPPTTTVGVNETAVGIDGVIVNVAVCVYPFAVADNTAVAVADTAVVGTDVLTNVCPAGTVTVAAGEASDRLEANATTKPPTGALHVMFTRNDVLVPPRTEVGVSTTLAGAGGRTLTTVDALTPARAAVTFTAVLAVTYKVLIPTLTVRDPVATEVVLVVTGTPAASPKPSTGLSDVTVNTHADGAGPSNVTVAVPVLEPVMFAGLDVTETTTGAVMVMPLLRTTPRALAVTVTGVAVAVGTVVAVNVADVCPSGIVTVAGTTTRVLDDETATTSPPAGALPSILIVPVTLFPPAMLDVDNVRSVMLAALTVTLLVLDEPFNEAVTTPLESSATTA